MNEHAHILLVDDDPIQSEVGRIMLEGLGCTVDVASNGLEGLELCKQRIFDLILMDWNMPIMDGFQATAAIRGLDSPIHDAPIIGTASTGTASACKQFGMDDFLAKPFTISTLKALLANWAAGKYNKPSA